MLPDSSHAHLNLQKALIIKVSIGVRNFQDIAAVYEVITCYLRVARSIIKQYRTNECVRRKTVRPWRDPMTCCTLQHTHLYIRAISYLTNQPTAFLLVLYPIWRSLSSNTSAIWVERETPTVTSAQHGTASNSGSSFTFTGKTKLALFTKSRLFRTFVRNGITFNEKRGRKL